MAWPISICTLLLLMFVVLAFRFPADLRAMLARFAGLKISSEGVAFEFYAAAVDEREDRRASKQELKDFPSGRVLWVDDQPANNRLELQTLRALGVDVDVATTNAEARAFAQTRAYDLVLSDVDRSAPEDETAGLALPGVLREAGLDVPVVYYVGHAESPLTPDGQPVHDQPSELFAEVRARLSERQR